MTDEVEGEAGGIKAGVFSGDRVLFRRRFEALVVGVLGLCLSVEEDGGVY